METFSQSWWVFPVAIATSVFALAIAAAFGAAIHALSAEPAWHVVVWSIPGVLIGSTIGSRIGRYLPARIMEKGARACLRSDRGARARAGAARVG